MCWKETYCVMLILQF
uniref:Uncharacterized protein n=1 Tax=Arundo donax TaxID=35708 RepID=A0A0A9GSZ6_ARUDO